MRSIFVLMTIGLFSPLFNDPFYNGLAKPQAQRLMNEQCLFCEAQLAMFEMVTHLR